jgi:hypothetical protein
MSKRTLSEMFDKNPKLFKTEVATNGAKAFNKEVVILKSLTKPSSSTQNDIILNPKKTKKTRFLTSPLLLSMDGLDTAYYQLPKQCKFHGRGYETQDLKRMLTNMKRWAFELNPGSAFPDFLNTCESLGKTKEIQAKMAQLRLIERARYTEQEANRIVVPKKTVSFESIEVCNVMKCVL